MTNAKRTPRTHELSEKRSRLYAHWLDGEWYKVAAPLFSGRLTSLVEGGLKLHALFGTRIAISDVQLTDSPLMAKLFYDQGFRNYLLNDRGFLTLVTKRREDGSHLRFSSATNGLFRATQSEDWTTSLPVPVEVVKQFARAVLNLQDMDTERMLQDGSLDHAQVIKANPEYEIYLRGILHGVCHFTHEKSGPLDVPEENNKSYMDVIEAGLNAPGQGDAYGTLENIYQSLNGIAEKTGNRFGRSAVVRHLYREEPDPRKWTPQQNKIWRSVVAAWNSNVSYTVGASETIAPLPEAVFPIRGLITDVSGPSKMEGDTAMRDGVAHLPPLLFDPDKLSWQEISNITQRSQIHINQGKLREAFRTGTRGEFRIAADNLVGGLSRELVPPPPGEWAWDVAERIAGVTNFLSHLFPDLPGEVGHVIDVLDYASEGASTIVHAHKYRHAKKEFAVLNTLRELQEDVISIYDSSAAAR